jgi:beta-lactamase superfamily II metal-dependent hydrolase
MGDFFEIDFLQVESKKSGDAIPLRYKINGQTHIHVTDGGFQDTGDELMKHINKYYNSPTYINAVIVSHPDGDHAGGLRKLFGEYQIGQLWMLRPWLYADEVINRFSQFTSVENLVKRLKELYPNLVILEDLAEQYDVQIHEPFQGSQIGAFTVMSPTKERYLDCIVESEKTPEAVEAANEELLQIIREKFDRIAEKARTYIRAAWGKEVFPEDDTSSENNMSIVQYAQLCGEKILLTADAGRAALHETVNYAPYAGLFLPGINRIQVPHHGSRHNVSTELLDCLLGPRLPLKPEKGKEKFTAIISAANKDKDHPRKTVIRAFIHRGANVISTEGKNISIPHNAPDREGWVPVEPIPYPEVQEN